MIGYIYHNQGYQYITVQSLNNVKKQQLFF